MDLDELLAADKERRDALAILEQKRARKNELSALIPKSTKTDRPGLIEEGKQVRADIEQLEPTLKRANDKFQELMLRVPSIPRPEVPIGRGEEDNIEVRRVGEIRTFDFTPKGSCGAHVELGARRLGWSSTIRRWPFLRSHGRRSIARASVLRLAVDTLVERGFPSCVRP